MIGFEKILIGRHIPLTLEKAKAVDVFGGKAFVAHDRRVVQRPPDHLPVLGIHQQAVAVMHRRPIIIEFSLRSIGKPEHACDRSQADYKRRLALRIRRLNLAFLPPKNHRFNGCDRRFSQPDVKLISPGEAQAVENREEMEFLVLRLRLAEPPIGEDGEFLGAVGFAAIQRETPRRSSVTLTPAEKK